MANLTYTVQVDWNDNGCWTDANEDVTSNVLRVDWRRGRGFPHHLAGQVRPGVARITLNNNSGIYSPLNSAGALFGDLVPGRKVRIRTQGSGSVGTRWQGFIQTIIPQIQAGTINTVILSCIGPLGFMADREVEVEMQTSITVDAAIGKILDAAGWPKDELYDDEVNADSPAGYWRLGESSGDAQDETANNNDGTVTGPTQGAASNIPSTTNGSYEWTANTDRVDFGSPSELDDIFAGGGAAEFVVTPDSAGTSGSCHFFNKFHTIAYGNALSGGAFRLGFQKQFSGANGNWETVGRPLTVDEVHHIVIIYDEDSSANDPTFVIDGCEYTIANGLMTEIATPSGTPTSDASRTLYLGNSNGFNMGVDGHIDEFALYDSTITVARAQAHYRAIRTWRDLDTAKTTMNRWWVDRMTVPEALRILEETENGLIYEAKDGSIAFRHGHDRFANRTSQATFSDAAAAALTYQGLRQADPARGIFNVLETQVQIFSVGSLATLWEWPDSVPAEAGPGETIVVRARYPVNDSPTEDVGVDAWTSPVENTDYDANSNPAGGGTDLSSSLTVTPSKFGESMSMSIANGHATLRAYLVDSGGTIKLQARGTPVSASDPLSVLQEDATSQADHGERTFEARDTWMPSYTDADAWARVNLDLYKDPSPVIAINIPGNRTSGTLDEVEDRDINDRITVRADGNANMGFNQDWFIEAEHHVVNELFEHRVTWDLSDPSSYDLYWQLNVSQLDTETKLAR